MRTLKASTSQGKRVVNMAIRCNSTTLEELYKTYSNRKHQALLEHVLDMWLTQKQIEHIKEGWHAFYNEPLKYKNSVVVDMVKLSLQEV